MNIHDDDDNDDDDDDDDDDVVDDDDGDFLSSPPPLGRLWWPIGSNAAMAALCNNHKLSLL